jgi:serine/threonine protein kinase
MPNRVGQQLGNYRLVRLLGRGGFAEVYLGEHRRLGTQAAIKVLYTHLAEQDVEAFLAEARTIASLEHPHIVRVLDFDVQEGIAFLVMSYASQGSLRLRHPKGSRLPLNIIVDYVKQVTSALQYAHNEKIIHRDIKPENMLLGRHNEVLLSDFGIALIAQSSRLQSTQEVIGTAQYMAPEQLQGKPRLVSDQYSLGVVVYEWLCGERPFQGTFTELFSQHMFVPPSPLHEKLPTISPDVEQVVLTALAKDPHQRFGSVQAFATALEQACQNVPMRPVTLPLDVPPPKQSSLLTNTVAASPPVQSTQLTGVFTPPSQILQPPVTAALFPTSTDNDRQGRHRSTTVLLIGLALLIVVGSFAFFLLPLLQTLPNIHATKVANAVATLVQANAATATTQAIVAASATATIAYNNYVQATSGTPVLDDSQIGCDFTGRAYHVDINQKNTFLVCYAQPTFSNFAFQAQMTILKGDYGGIIFRTNKDNAFGYRFAFGLGICNFHYGDKELANSSIRANLNQVYLLTAIARGSSISLYIDKQWVATVEDNSAGSGGIGLMAGDFANAADVAFRNVQVWNL